TAINVELLAKRLELIRELLPRATAIGFLVNPDNLNTVSNVQELETLARAGGWRLQVVPVRNETELGSAFARFKELKIDGSLAASDALLTNNALLMAVMEPSHAIPGIHQTRQFAEAGGLISYGPKGGEASRQAGVYTGRILKGEKPADLPVMQPTKFETVL